MASILASSKKRRRASNIPKIAEEKNKDIEDEVYSNNEEELNDDDDNNDNEYNDFDDDQDAYDDYFDDNGNDNDGNSDGEEEEKTQKSALLKKSSIRTSKRSKYSTLPTADEQSHLRETEDLFQTNLMKLSIAEMMKEVQVDYEDKGCKKMEKWLFTFKQYLETIPKQNNITESTIDFHNLKIFHGDSKEVSLNFLPPQKIDIIGSYLIRTITKPQTNIDLAIKIPSKCFTKNDIGNYRYFNKKLLYIGYLAKKLSENQELCKSIEIVFFKGDFKKPIIKIVPGTKTCFFIRLFPTIDHEIFPEIRLLPNKNNNKMSHLFQQNESEVPNANNSQENFSPTPHYNNAILEDCFFLKHLSDLHSISTASPAFIETVIITKVWLRQRGHLNSYNSIDGFILSMLLLYLIKTKKLSIRMGTFQMFQAFLKFIVDMDFKEAILIIPGDHDENHQALTEEIRQSFKKAFDVVFLDASGRLNITSRVSLCAIEELKAEATSSLALLHVNSHDAFFLLFLKNSTFWDKYDLFVQFPIPFTQVVQYPQDQQEITFDCFSLEECHTLCDLPLWEMAVQKVDKILSKGLGDRIVSMGFYPDRDTYGSSDSKVALGSSVQFMTIGFRLNLLTYGRSVEKGPDPTNTEESAAFREFWKDKAELRRFKDGSILEAVVWSGFRYNIMEQIIRYLFEHHLSNVIDGSTNSIRVIGSEFNELIATEDTEMDTAFRNAVKVFDEFSNCLRELKSLPLTIETIRPVSSSLRYSSIFPPVPHPLANPKANLFKVTKGMTISTIIEPMEVLIKLEASSKWPNEIDAIGNIKTAFLLKITEQIQKQFKLRCNVDREYTDVFYDGFVFRLRISSEIEWALFPKFIRQAPQQKLMSIIGKKAAAQTLQSQDVSTTPINPLGNVEKSQQEAEKMIEIVSKVRIETFARPAHHAMIHTLQMKAPLFSSVVRVALRWLHAHMFSSHLREEAVELLVAHLFLSPQPLQGPPTTLVSGLLRFLLLLADFDWKDGFIFVDVNDEINQKQLDTVSRAFDISRESFAQYSPAMYIVAPYDQTQNWCPTWTINKPEKVVLARISSVAKRCSETLLDWMKTGPSSKVTEEKKYKWRDIFSTPLKQPKLSGFDVLIHINSEYVVGAKDYAYLNAKELWSKKQKGSKAFRMMLFKNLKFKKNKVFVGESPVFQFFNAISEQFELFGVFFIDITCPDVIAIVWRPSMFIPQPFSISQCRWSIMINPPQAKNTSYQKNQVNTVGIPNIAQLLSEIRVIGGDLIETIELI